MAKRWVSWSAVSTLPQAKKISLQDQKSEARRHVAQHGGELIAELEVPGKSRSIILLEDACRQIDTYARLKEMIDTQSFDVLIYLDRGRLGRKASLSMAIVELCHDAGIVTYEMEAPPSTLEVADTYDARIIGAFKSVSQQEEIVKFGYRHSRGMLERVKAGNFPSAPPWGWIETKTIIDGKVASNVTVDQAAQAALLFIAERYLHHGDGTRTIAEMLQERAFASPSGAPWRRDNVQDIVRRALRYAGVLEYNKKHDTPQRPYIQAKMRWPVLITEELANQILAEMNRRRSARRSVGSTHRFSQCVWCKVCNRPMIGNHRYSYNKSNKDIRYPSEIYRCSVEPRHSGGNISARKIESAYRGFINELQNEKTLQAIIDSVPDHRPEIEARITELKSQVDSFRPAVERADDAFVAGRMDAERYQRQVDTINGKIATIQQQIGLLEGELLTSATVVNRPQRVRSLAEEGMQALENPDVRRSNAWLRSRIRFFVQDSNVVAVVCS